MRIKVTMPGDKSGVVECSETGALAIVEGGITLDDMRASLHGVRPNSAVGEVNSLDAEAHLVLRSLESAGWLVDWPEVEGGDDDPDDDEGIPNVDNTVN
ncbi:hypothetical protein CJP72_12305 [Citrobacter sp. NCU1]|uniref:hypothetical protein n=1 Tax=Citrobacter sp. NCU1 TaxID=2026683 RepID=UPI0013913C91|nr:hypothetical protein [Citrobacter sp. NCU1]NDO81518.1 hypothetical protein [Citrobacter sp. NCU1]